MFNNSGHGIDGIYRKFDTGDIALLESKWRGKWSAGRKMEKELRWGYGALQMSPRWILAVEDRLRQAGMIAEADNVAMQSARFMNILDGTGTSYFKALP